MCVCDSSPGCSSLFLHFSCSSLSRSSCLQGCPSWFLGMMVPWKGHWRTKSQSSKTNRQENKQTWSLVNHLVFFLTPWGGPVSDTAFRCPVEHCSNGWQEWSSQGRRCIYSCSLPGAPCSPPPLPHQREPRTDAERTFYKTWDHRLSVGFRNLHLRPFKFHLWSEKKLLSKCVSSPVLKKYLARKSFH